MYYKNYKLTILYCWFMLDSKSSGPSSKRPIFRRCFGVETDNDITSPTASWKPSCINKFVFRILCDVYIKNFTTNHISLLFDENMKSILYLMRKTLSFTLSKKLLKIDRVLSEGAVKRLLQHQHDNKRSSAKIFE